MRPWSRPSSSGAIGWHSDQLTPVHPRGGRADRGEARDHPLDLHLDPLLGREEVRRFQAVVVGSPVHSGQWERDAVEFLLQRATLRMRGGRSGDSRDWQAIDSWTDEVARQLSTSGSVR